MRFSVLRWLSLALAVLAAPFLSACGYNDFQAKDEATKAAWAEVVNQYQRRADLIPNLVNTVKGYASHERETLEAVTRARAAATSIRSHPRRSRTRPRSRNSSRPRASFPARCRG